MKDQHKEWVLKYFPKARCQQVRLESLKGYVVRLDPDDEKGCGSGRTAPSAWRDAYYSKEFLDRKDAQKQ